MWITLVAGEYLLLKVLRINLGSIHTVPTQGNIFSVFANIISKIFHPNQPLIKFKDSINILLYGSVYGIFLAALYLNDWSMVLGDKTAHVVSLHFTQILYYCSFCLIFCLPVYLSRVKSIFYKMYKRKYLTILTLVLTSLIVNYNSLIHPFLLADNRHYTFYFVKNVLRSSWLKFTLIPVYVFAFFGNVVLYLDNNNIISFLTYFGGTLGVIVTHSLIEIRYFLMSYYIFRSRIYVSRLNVLICEFFINLGINIIYFYIFFTKEIRWSDFSEPQRIIW